MDLNGYAGFQSFADNGVFREFQTQKNKMTSGKVGLNEWQHKEITSSHVRAFGSAFGDVDGDGDKEIFAARFMYRNPGGDMMGDWEQSKLPVIRDVLLCVDVDDDENLDIIGMDDDEGEGSLYWLEAVNQGNSWNSTKIGKVGAVNHKVSLQGFKVADVFPGGKPELILHGRREHFGVYAWKIPDNPESGNWEHIRIAKLPYDNWAQGLGIGYIDDDAFLDLAPGDRREHTYWFRGDGTENGDWEIYSVAPVFRFGPDRNEIADLDGDGDGDIVSGEESTHDKLYWTECPDDPYTSEPTWERHILQGDSANGGASSVDIADLDFDGDIDIVHGQHRESKELNIWENDGHGNFTKHSIDKGKESHIGARLSDLDGDGDLDIVSVAWFKNNIINMWRNDNGSP